MGAWCFLPSGLTTGLQGRPHHMPSQMGCLRLKLPSTTQLKADASICSRYRLPVYTLNDSAAGQQPYNHFYMTESPQKSEILGVQQVLIPHWKMSYLEFSYWTQPKSMWHILSFFVYFTKTNFHLEAIMKIPILLKFIILVYKHVHYL